MISISRVSAEKRLDLAGGALDRLPPDVWLWIIGHGGEQDRIREAAGPSAGRVVCSAPQQDVGAALAAADAAILLPRDEGYCLAAVEALAAGVPLVATPVGILPQFEDCAEWLPIDPTLGQVADGILAAFVRDRAKVKQSRRLVIAEHSAEAMARSWAALLTTLCVGASPKAL